MAGGSKNNPANRLAASSYKMLDGKKVEPVLYYGRNAGHGTYMAGQVDGQTVVDHSGRPVPYKQI
jgi:hypothetical protein